MNLNLVHVYLESNYFYLPSIFFPWRSWNLLGYNLMVIQQRNKILWKIKVGEIFRWIKVVVESISHQSSKHLSPWPNVPINSNQNQDHLRPGQRQSLLWALCFREPCMSQAQKFIEYKTCRPSVTWDLALATCNPKHLLLWLISLKPQRNGCLSYISCPMTLKQKVTACQYHEGLWHVELLTSDTNNA